MQHVSVVCLYRDDIRQDRNEVNILVSVLAESNEHTCGAPDVGYLYIPQLIGMRAAASGDDVQNLSHN